MKGSVLVISLLCVFAMTAQSNDQPKVGGDPNQSQGHTLTVLANQGKTLTEQGTVLSRIEATQKSTLEEVASQKQVLNGVAKKSDTTELSTLVSKLSSAVEGISKQQAEAIVASTNFKQFTESSNQRLNEIELNLNRVKALLETLVEQTKVAPAPPVAPSVHWLESLQTCCVESLLKVKAFFLNLVADINMASITAAVSTAFGHASHGARVFAEKASSTSFALRTQLSQRLVVAGLESSTADIVALIAVVVCGIIVSLFVLSVLYKILRTVCCCCCKGSDNKKKKKKRSEGKSQ